MSILECHVLFFAVSNFKRAWFSSCRMAPRKGFSPFTRVISPELSVQLNWYILCSKVCGSTLTQYFKRSPVVASFPGDFQRMDSAHIPLQDGRHYSNKKSSNAIEIVCSLFGLITTLLRRSSLESSEFISQLRDLLNIVDPSNISVDEKNESQASKRPRASRRLEMPTTATNKTSSSVAMTPPKQWKLAKSWKQECFPKSKRNQRKGRFGYSRKGAVDEAAKQSRHQGRAWRVRQKQGKFGHGSFKYVRIWRPRSEGHRQRHCRRGGCKKGSKEECGRPSWRWYHVKVHGVPESSGLEACPFPGDGKSFCENVAIRD